MTERLRGLALVVGLLVALSGCGKDGGRGRGEATGGVGDNALPAPAGAPGTSVTGMPTSPPPPPAVVAEAEVATAQADPEPAATPEPVDGGVPVDPATGLAASAELSTPAGVVDSAGAAAVMREYAAALGSGAYARAQQLWAGAPNDGPALELARGSAFSVEVLAPGRIADAGGQPMVSVPVEMRGIADDGSERSISAVYTVRLTPEGQWRIGGASMRID